MNTQFGKLNVVIFLIFVLSSTIHFSSAQTTHTVGNGLGWIVPPGGEVAYRTWAASQTFTVGDVLVFNFTTGIHDVAEVSREAYNSCNSTSPISLYTTGPTNITLTSSAEQHFICTFGMHCALGQRLAINVSAASPAPAPEPTTPPPSAAPETAPAPQPVTPSPSAAPQPSRPAMTYIVGDSLGWTVPPGGAIAYQTWARGRTFMVGDILVFNFTTGEHDVVEVTRAEYNLCNANPSNTIITTGPARITITSEGEHYYLCAIPQHCSLGQQLAINVTSGGSSATPSPTAGGPTQQSPGTPPPPPPASNSATNFIVTTIPLTFFAVVVLAFLYN